MKKILCIVWVLPVILFSCDTAVKENTEQRKVQARDAAHGQIVGVIRPDAAESCEPNQ